MLQHAVRHGRIAPLYAAFEADARGGRFFFYPARNGTQQQQYVCSDKVYAAEQSTLNTQRERVQDERTWEGLLDVL